MVFFMDFPEMPEKNRGKNAYAAEARFRRDRPRAAAAHHFMRDGQMLRMLTVFDWSASAVTRR